MREGPHMLSRAVVVTMTGKFQRLRLLWPARPRCASALPSKSWTSVI